MLRPFCRPHAYTFNEQSKMVTALTLQTKHKNQHKFLFKIIFIIYFIKSQTNDSFVNHFDGLFAYLKTLDFSFKLASNCVMNYATALPSGGIRFVIPESRVCHSYLYTMQVG